MEGPIAAHSLAFKSKFLLRSMQDTWNPPPPNSVILVKSRPNKGRLKTGWHGVGDWEQKWVVIPLGPTLRPEGRPYQPQK
eukprot:754318-Pyramimonas_sp.AAC.1